MREPGGGVPENTVEALDLAMSGGADAVEIDVRVARGGALVVFHDGRTLGRDVASVPRAELRVSPPREGSAALAPTFAEVVAWAEARRAPLNVELKRDVPRRLALVRDVARLVSRARVDVLFSSFDPVILAALAVLAPAYPRALLTHDGQRFAGSLHALARPPLVSAVHPQHTACSAPLVRHLLARGLAVGAWTVNEPATARVLLDRGVSWLITDRPAQLASALGRGAAAP